jgi:polar amino acid transport system substrate-binding protein
VVTLPTFRDPNKRPERPSGDIGPIRFLTSGDFPPFNFLDRNGALVGYHIELARAICGVLKTSCTIQMRPFGDLVTALEERRGDAIIAGLKPTRALRATLDFTEAYLGTPARFIGRRGARLDDAARGLSGRWVAAVAGSTHLAFILENFPQAKVAAYPGETEARNALRDGAVDFVFGDGVSASFWLNGPASRGCCSFAGAPFVDPAYFGEGLKIAVAASNTRLRRALDVALYDLEERGVMLDLYLRAFPLGFY